MRITKGLIWLFLASGLFVGGGILANRMGYLPEAFRKGGDHAHLFEIALRIAGTLLIAPPITFVVIAMFSAGSDKVTTGRYGMKVMRLRSGARMFGALLSFGLSALFFLGPYYDAGVGLTLLLAPFGIFFVIAGLWCLAARITYDTYEVSGTDYLFRFRRYNWFDLTGIEYLPEAYEYHLLFERGGKLHVSVFYAGVDRLIDLAETKLPDA